jgi:uncharacterized coiled-coil DUF342 family protein
VSKWKDYWLTSSSSAKKAAVNGGNKKLIKKRRTEMGIATEMKELTKDIASSHEDRMKRIGEIREEANEVREEAQDLVSGFHTSRKRETAELRRDLARGEAERKTDVKKMLKGFQSSRREEGTQVRKELAQGVVERRSELREMRGDFRKAQAEVRDDLREAAAAWQELANTMQAKRARPEAPVPKQKAPALEAKLLAAVNEHPEGITLAEVANSLGVAFVVLGRASKSLLKKGKICKKDKFYFPGTGQ